MDYSLDCELIDGAGRLVVGVDLDQWFGPIPVFFVFAIDRLPDVPCGNFDETARKLLIVGDDVVAKLEGVHVATREVGDLARSNTMEGEDLRAMRDFGNVLISDYLP